MTSAATPRHVFVSFSWKDKPAVEHLINELQGSGIPIWTDYRVVTPGTPEWERAVHQAIAESFAIVLAASPNSAKSPHVRNELALARSFRRQLVLAWIDGTDWPASVPTGMAQLKYVDCRSHFYMQGVSQLADALKDLIGASIPKHYLLSPLRRKVIVNGEPELVTAPVPPRCVCVELSSGATEATDSESPGVAAVMKLTEYPAFQPLIDDLHANYLSDLFRAGTYGADWVLAESRPYLGRLAVPWCWLQCQDRDAYRMDRSWSSKAPLPSCGLADGTSWRVVPARGVEAVGLAINDMRILYALMSGPDVMKALRRHNYLAKAPVSAIPPDRFKFSLVLLRSTEFLDEADSVNCAFFQTKVPVPPAELDHWIGR